MRMAICRRSATAAACDGKTSQGPQGALLVILFVASVSVSCDGPSNEIPSSEGAVPSVSHSAGVLHMVRIRNLEALDLPEVTKTLIYSTAAESPGLDLTHVVGAVFLPDSSLAIADKGQFEVIVLDQHGSVQAREGRRGEGPGEYLDIARIGIGADGGLFVYDRVLRRLTFPGSKGEVAGVQRIERSGEMVPLVRLEDGSVLAALETRPPFSDGLQRGPLFLVHGDFSGGRPSDENVDTLGRWVGKERFTSRDMTQLIPVGFGATALFSGHSAYSVVGTNDSLDVTLYERLTPLTRIYGGHSHREVSDDEKEAWTELFVEMYPEDFRPRRRRLLEQSTVRGVYPAFGALKVDGHGRIWIGAFAKLADMDRRWTVLGPRGTPIGILALPVFRPAWFRYRLGMRAVGREAVEYETTIPSPSHELLDIRNGRMAILRRGELGEESVEVYDVEVPVP